MSASVAGDGSWILENFVAVERKEASKRLTDPVVAGRARNYYRKAGKVETINWAEVRGFKGRVSSRPGCGRRLDVSN